MSISDVPFSTKLFLNVTLKERWVKEFEIKWVILAEDAEGKAQSITQRKEKAGTALIQYLSVLYIEGVQINMKQMKMIQH